ncbi:transcription initiation factor TFIID subunit 4 [Erinaceus europaeus]|uniref:Transcription initiation factor TFIID subunit 4 n=1 Tax=Erinaceus europaeus TaxID=9365 RepID=A0ABM3WUX8_ERIEU|nr:transcription initiation factor TFIID subunit 4 [Erinaceus europaeus]
MPLVMGGGGGLGNGRLGARWKLGWGGVGGRDKHPAAGARRFPGLLLLSGRIPSACTIETPPPRARLTRPCPRPSAPRRPAPPRAPGSEPCAPAGANAPSTPPLCAPCTPLVAASCTPCSLCQVPCAPEPRCSPASHLSPLPGHDQGPRGAAACPTWQHPALDGAPGAAVSFSLRPHGPHPPLSTPALAANPMATPLLLLLCLALLGAPARGAGTAPTGTSESPDGPTAAPTEGDTLQNEEDNQENVLSQLLGDYDKVKAVSEGSDCRCKCVVRPLGREACERVQQGTTRKDDFYTVETITSGPACKCACVAPPSALNPCEGDFRLQKLREADSQDLKLATVIDMLEGAFYGLDLLKLHSVTTKLVGRMDKLEEVRSGLISISLPWIKPKQTSDTPRHFSKKA